MNMQTINTTTLSVKVTLGGEIRRFDLEKLSFSRLEQILFTIYSLEAGTLLRVNFQDDEGDMVVLSSDEELQHAFELSASPLRLSLQVTGRVETPLVTVPGDKVEMKADDWKDKKDKTITRQERLNAKHERLSNRIQFLEKHLSNPSLPSDRQRVLRWKLAQFQEKLEATKEEKLALLNPTPESFNTEPRKFAPRGHRRFGPEEDCETNRPGRGNQGRAHFRAIRTNAGPESSPAQEFGHVNGRGNGCQGRGPARLRTIKSNAVYEFPAANENGNGHQVRGAARLCARNNPVSHFPANEIGNGFQGRGAGRAHFRAIRSKQVGDCPVVVSDSASPLAPSFVDEFQQLKIALKEARKSGNSEAIESCQKALSQAKQERREKLSALVGPQRVHYRECLRKVKEANRNGDEELAKKAQEEAAEAITNLKAAKISFFA